MKPENLKPGKLYFHCSYAHPRYPIPNIETWVYLGKNIFDEQESTEDEYVFQMPEKYYIDDLRKEVDDAEYLNDLEIDKVILHETQIETIVKDLEGTIAWVASLKDMKYLEEIF